MQDARLANHPGVLKLFNKLGSMMGDTLPVGGSNIPGSFNNSVQGIQSQLQAIDMDYSDLILSNPSQLKVGDSERGEFCRKEHSFIVNCTLEDLVLLDI